MANDVELSVPYSEMRVSEELLIKFENIVL